MKYKKLRLTAPPPRRPPAPNQRQSSQYQLAITLVEPDGKGAGEGAPMSFGPTGTKKGSAGRGDDQVPRVARAGARPGSQVGRAFYSKWLPLPYHCQTYSARFIVHLQITRLHIEMTSLPMQRPRPGLTRRA